jgi:hypothetical protein
MVLTWHLQRTIKSWILFVQKMKDTSTLTCCIGFLKICGTFWLGNCPLFLSQVDCIAKLDGCIFDGSYGNWIVMRVVSYYLLLIL